MGYNFYRYMRMGKYIKGFRKEKWRIKKNEALNEVFFYDPYKKKTQAEKAVDAFRSLQISLKEFGMTCHEVSIKMNLAIKQVNNLKELK